MGRKYILAALAAMAITAIGFSCSRSSNDAAVASGKNLYIATGQCNSGSGITTLSSTLSSRMVSKVNLASKSTSIVFDLAAAYQGGYFAPETGAQSIADNGTSLMLLTENATSPSGGRKVFSIPKSNPFNTVIFADDSNAFTQAAPDITRAIALNTDNTFLFSKSISIEKINTNTLRIPKPGPLAFVEAPGGTCATSTTFISALAVMAPFTGTSAGKIIYAHQGATAASNRLGIISNDGYALAADCLDGQTIGSATHANDTGVVGTALTIDGVAGASPTAMVYIPTPAGPATGKLIVGYSAAVNTAMDNSSNINHAIVMYDITETSATAATISNTATVLYRDSANVFGISAMAYDATDSSLYVATASQTGTPNQTTQAYGYKVEKFTLTLANAGTAPILTLVRGTNNAPFLDRSSLTKCITSMAVGD